MKTKTFLISITAILAVALSGCSHQDELSPGQARQIAKEAYIYGFPLVVNYKTMYMYAVNPNSPEYKGGFNNLACVARVYTPKDKAIVAPNSDTPYCMFWGDLRTEPLVLTIPKMEKNRFYQVQLIDLYTHNFAYVSTVTKGNVPGNYLITGPGWQGKVPKNIKEVIHSETNMVFSIIRTQLFDSKDVARVKEIQAGYQFQPLSTFLGTPAPPAAPAVKFPNWHEGDQFNINSFKYINFVLSLSEKLPDEKKLMKRFAKIGIGTLDSFDINQFSPEIQKALKEGVKDGFAEIEAFIKKFASDPLASAKIFGTRKFLKESAVKNYGLSNFYVMRAVAAHTGLYGNSGKEAVYPVYFTDSAGQPLNTAKNNYRITFAKGQLPPVNAFWSLTMYDSKTQLLVENLPKRYLLNSTMMKQFVMGKDGSLTLYIQKVSPGKKLESNWLPAPDGPFFVILRLYGAKEAPPTGKWENPPLVKVQ